MGQGETNGRRPGMGCRLEWTTDISPGLRSAARSPGIHPERCSGSRQVQQRRAYEDSQLSAFNSSGYQETMRSPKAVLHRLAQGTGNRGEGGQAFPGGDHHIGLSACTADHPESDGPNCDT